MVEGIALGMVLRALLDTFQVLEQHPHQGEMVDVILEPLHLGFEVEFGAFLA